MLVLLSELSERPHLGRRDWGSRWWGLVGFDFGGSKDAVLLLLSASFSRSCPKLLRLCRHPGWASVSPRLMHPMVDYWFFVSVVVLRDFCFGDWLLFFSLACPTRRGFRVIPV